MNINMRNKTVCIFGLRGTGKSTWAHRLADEFGSAAFVYDTLGETPGSAKYFAYVPASRTSTAELNGIIPMVIKSGRFRLLLIDEANRFAPSKPAPLPKELADLNDQCRHYGLSVGYIARRPVQLNQDLTELSDYLVIFALKGIRDIKYLNDLSGGLGDAVLALPRYHYILVMPDRSYRQIQPVAPTEEWIKRHGRAT